MSTQSAVYAQRTIEVDVCIYGGTSAGVIAAYTAQKLGKTTVIIEPGNRLGGMSSGGLGYTDIGNKYVVTGLARDFYRRIGSHYGKFEQWIFEPKVAEAIFQDYVKRGNIQVIYQNQLREVIKSGNRITAILLENSRSPAAMPLTTIKAAMFIDCGYEGDLMAKAGISYIVGREDNNDFKETLNGVQLMKGHQFSDGIDPYKIKGDPQSGLLWGISDDKLDPQGTGDKKVQAYNYRICLSDDPNNQVKITRPSGYDSTRYDLLVRLFEANPQKIKLNDYFIWSRMPNNKTDINNRGGFSTDMIGMNYEYPDGDYETKKRIINDHEVYTKGLLYFFGNDARVPKPLREEMLKWGYPKDEYTDNGNWSPQLYIREARRLIGSYVMTQANCEGKEQVTDGVGMAAYTMDSHNCQRLVIDGQVKNEGNVEVGGFDPYPISYRAIIPKPAECVNLLVPVCLSATHIAYGSIRMEPVFMVLAQSAANAAVMAIDQKIGVNEVDVKKLKEELIRNPLATGRIADVVVDNEETANVVVMGTWSTEKKGGYGPTYLVHDPVKNTLASVRFTPRIPVAGRYKAYIYLPKIANASTKLSLIIHDGKKQSEVVINSSNIKVEGQTSGEWALIGEYKLSAGKNVFVEVTSNNADGKIVADAVILVPQTK